MSTQWLRFLLMITSVSLCAACLQPRSLPSAPLSPLPTGTANEAGAVLDNTEWVLTTLRGKPLLKDTFITLKLKDHYVSGYAGCNWYSDQYQADATMLKVGDLPSTARGCNDPKGVMEQEATFIDAFRTVRMYQVTGDVLSLKDAAGEPLLQFHQRVPLAMHPADLISKVWQLERMDGQPLLPGLQITLIFDNGQALHGYTGCRDYQGQYQAEGDELALSRLEMTQPDCHTELVAQQEGQYFTMLSQASNYKLSAAQLEILTSTGAQLVFMAQQ